MDAELIDAARSKLNLNTHAARLVQHLRMPLFGNGYALVASSLLTSGIGLFYWIVAARGYGADVVGVNSALISTMGFLANLSMLNMGNLLNRFVPSAGKQVTRLVLTTYAVSIVVSALTGAVFVIGQPVWAPRLSILHQDWRFTLWFIASTVLWCVFVLQDSVLTGLRQAVWVPIENLIFALLKIALLLLFAALIPISGIYFSWTVPVILIVPAINVLIFGRIIPRQTQAGSGSGTPLTLRRAAAFAGADYLGSLIMIAVVDLMPLLVIERAGAPATAYFYLAWTISYTLYLVTRNMGNSLIAEAAADERRLALYSRKMLKHILRLVVPAALLIALAAPLILQVFGSDYSSEAAVLLRLLALSAIPNVVTALYVSILRVRFQIVKLIVTMLALCAMIVGLSVILLDLVGITGVGIAWLVSEAVIAIVLLLTEMRPLWFGHLKVAPANDVRKWVKAIILKHPERDRRVIETHISELTAAVQTQSGLRESADWHVLDQLPVVKDGAAYYLGSHHRPSALLKLSGSPSSVQSLGNHMSAVQQLHALPELEEWRTVLPRVIAHGTLRDQLYVVETLLPGINAVEALGNSLPAEHLLPLLIRAIDPLHRMTSHPVVVDDALFAEWVRTPISLIKTALGKRSVEVMQALIRLEHELSDSLLGKPMNVGWIHGDYAPENILVDRATHQVTGIVDWELARRNALPQMDCVWLMMSTHLHQHHEELGNVVIKLLSEEKNAVTDATHQRLRDLCANAAGETTTPRVLILLTWLHHVSSNLRKADRYKESWFWLSTNVESVLFYL